VIVMEPDLATESDARLVLLARGEPTGPAFRALYERHKGEVQRFLVRLLDDDALAEDAVQETFFRVYWHLERFDGARAFRPWLLQIARNVGLNVLRARRKGPQPPGDQEDDARAVSDRVARQAAEDEDARAARAALATLPDDDRALLIERHGLGLKLTDLAEAYGCTERTIRNRLHAAIERLTQALLTGGRS
jgi:RNA polymerase sigma-70 factor, ECF subfamily